MNIIKINDSLSPLKIILCLEHINGTYELLLISYNVVWKRITESTCFVIAFFGWKLYQSLKDREKRREEKKKLKQKKKK